MISREELLSHKEYWITKIQIELFNHCEEYLKRNNLNRTQLAEKLGVTKGYISQVLNGDYDHRISKFVELCLAIGKVPVIEFEDIEQIIEKDKRDDIKKNKPYKAKISHSLVAEKKDKYRKTKPPDV